jgi:broad specificity phosphatase PhoE
MVSVLVLGSALARFVAAFLRHGEFHQRARVPSAHLPHPLTPEGEAQAAAAVDDICRFAAESQLRIDPVIDSSNLLRAWQTAGILSVGLQQRTGDPVKLEGFDDLAERSLGSAANLTLDEIDAVMAADPRFEVPPANWKSSSHYQLPLLGAESLMQAGLRVARHVRTRIAGALNVGAAGMLKIFVGHGASFRHAAVDLGALQIEDVQGLSMFHCRPVFLAPAEDGRWQQVGGTWKERRSNEELMD